MPNFRLRLPSRNWTIFLTIVGSWTAAVIYDKREKKKIQKKWCDLVAHISQQPLPVNELPRRLTIFLSAPPGDGIRPSRQYFKEYVKPVLVAAAMDYDVIEGRKEGDVRYGTAEQIRRLRRKKGEKGGVPIEQEMDAETAIEMVREKMHVVPEPVIRGDLVLGRHTWKEYVRGLHEGWLGPIEEPPSTPKPQLDLEPSPIHPPTEPRTDDPAAMTEPPESEKPEEGKEKEKEKKPFPPPAYLSIDKYSSAPLSPHIPPILEPSQPIHQQHLLGFLKTPQRIYNFLTRRHLADQIGRETAAIVLAASRPYQQDSTLTSPNPELEADPIATRAPESNSDTPFLPPQTWEQQSVLLAEEPQWHKSVRKPRKEDDKSEPLWTSAVVIDERIGSRMRKFELDPEEAARAERIAKGQEKTMAREVMDLRAEKVQVGNLDDE